LIVLDAAAFRQAHEDLRDYVGLGGLTLRASGSPWAPAFDGGSIVSAEQARAAIDGVATLSRTTVPSASAACEQLLQETGLRRPADLASWAEMFGLLDRVATTLGTFRPDVFAAPLDELTAGLAPAASGWVGRTWASITNGSYRRSKKATRALLTVTVL
jgi:hypothetical protein